MRNFIEEHTLENLQRREGTMDAVFSASVGYALICF